MLHLTQVLQIVADAKTEQTHYWGRELNVSLNLSHLLLHTQVVVDDAKTAQTLLEKGRLTQRVTIIPLDKVRARIGECVFAHVCLYGWEEGEGGLRLPVRNEGSKQKQEAG